MANVAPFAPHVVKVRFDQSYGGAVNIMNRLFYQFTGTIDQAAGTTIATRAATLWNSSFAPLLSTTYVLNQVVVTDLGSDSGTQVVHPSGQAGTLPATDFLPATTAMCFNGLISRRYRGGKPRWYQTGFHQSSLQDNQTFNANAINTWEAAFAELAGGMLGAITNGGTVTTNINLSLVEGYTWTPYTTSSGKENYRKDPLYRSAPLEDPINAWIPLARVSNQRKRGVN